MKNVEYKIWAEAYKDKGNNNKLNLARGNMRKTKNKLVNINDIEIGNDRLRLNCLKHPSSFFFSR